MKVLLLKKLLFDQLLQHIAVLLGGLRQIDLEIPRCRLEIASRCLRQLGDIAKEPAQRFGVLMPFGVGHLGFTRDLAFTFVLVEESLAILSLWVDASEDVTQAKSLLAMFHESSCDFRRGATVE
ncbi:MAG: hypothetical protein SGJ19_06595 [Planctomycetia bacterium]|nr:hypothetical protein [Planctomycetia bacterium]